MNIIRWTSNKKSMSLSYSFSYRGIRRQRQRLDATAAGTVGPSLCEAENNRCKCPQRLDLDHCDRGTGRVAPLPPSNGWRCRLCIRSLAIYGSFLMMCQNVWFLNWIFIFLRMHFKNSWCILNRSPLSDRRSANIFSWSVACLLSQQSRL